MLALEFFLEGNDAPEPLQALYGTKFCAQSESFIESRPGPQHTGQIRARNFASFCFAHNSGLRYF